MPEDDEGLRSALRIVGRRLSSLLCHYYKGPDHPLKLRIWSLIRRLSEYPRLTIPYATRGWITVDERDLIDRTILVAGAYEPEVWETLAAFATAEEVVWDVGAHIGTHTIRALFDTRIAQVIAFEPDPERAAILRANLALNPGQHRVCNIALDEVPAVRRLYRTGTTNTGRSSLLKRDAVSTHMVECCTADLLVFRHGLPTPTLLKIDVEGWERQVLRGATNLLRLAPPKAIVFETAADKKGRAVDPRLQAQLEEAGYHVSHIRRPSGVVEANENFLAARG